MPQVWQPIVFEEALHLRMPRTFTAEDVHTVHLFQPEPCKT